MSTQNRADPHESRPFKQHSKQIRFFVTMDGRIHDRCEFELDEHSVYFIDKDSRVHAHVDFSKKVPADPLKVLTNTDIWVHEILPFVGPGHFVFVAGVCRRFKELYLQYFSAIKDPPLVQYGFSSKSCNFDFDLPVASEKAIPRNTFYRAAFTSVSCAKYWNELSTEDEKRTSISRLITNAYQVVAFVNAKEKNLGQSRVCEVVAAHGNLQVLKWAYQHGFPWDKWTCTRASGNGHLEVLQYAHENGCPWDTSRTCAYAAENGHLVTLKYARENGCPWDYRTCEAAAENGQLEALKYAHENGCPWDGCPCAAAVKNGHLEVLKWAQENGCLWNEWTCELAAEYGQLETLQYAHANGCYWDKRTCYQAAKNGHLDILKYAHLNGCPWDKQTCYQAAKNGHLDIMIYAHENGCPWDKSTSKAAASKGQLEILKYAHENGCPWDEDTYNSAVRLGHKEIVEYAKNNGCPGAPPRLSVFQSIMKYMRAVAIVLWMHRYGFAVLLPLVALFRTSPYLSVLLGMAIVLDLQLWTI